MATYIVEAEYTCLYLIEVEAETAQLALDRVNDMSDPVKLPPTGVYDFRIIKVALKDA